MLTLYMLNFLLSAHGALVVFFGASFLASRGMADSVLGTLYIAGSLLALVLYYYAPLLFKKYGIYKTLVTLTVFEFFIYAFIGMISSVPLIMLLFVLSFAIPLALFYGLDILIESATESEEDTGDDRSILLTVGNVAFVLSPFVAGMVLKTTGFAELYVLAALFLVPFLYFLHKVFHAFKDPTYTTFSLIPVIHKLKKDINILHIFIVQFLLRAFYAWMTIYTPLYLHQHIGFSLPVIGTIFSVMLIPFILLEYPLGHYADKRYGEKEFLILGFSILAFATYLLSFITTTDLALWMLLLFVTRIGAAIVEVMNEIYFFKHVDGSDTDTISAFRMIYPLAYIIGPAFGSLFLLAFPMQYMFGALGIVLLGGILVSMLLKDTK